MERERGDLAENLGRDAPERRQAATRTSRPVSGDRLWRQHRGESVYEETQDTKNNFFPGQTPAGVQGPPSKNRLKAALSSRDERVQARARCDLRQS